MDQSERQVIFSQKAPAMFGPYSQAIQAGNLVFTAGQIGLDPQAEFFPANLPARATVQVAALPKGAAIEIEVVALAGS